MGLATNLALVIFAGICITRCQEVAADNDDTLELLQVLVRHGNRTSAGAFTQFLAQYIETFHPFEFGQLTPRGRQEAARFGKLFRKQYEGFLPEEFSYSAVSVNSSGITRCVETALISMAAMFPPKNVQKWGDSVLGTTWTPITPQTVPKKQDVVFQASDTDCPRLVRLQADVHKDPRFLARYNELTGNGTVIEHIQRSLNMSSSEPLSEHNLESMWDNLNLLENSEIPLPEWSKAVYPSPLTEINSLAFWTYYGSRELLMFTVGQYLREVLNIAKSLEARTLRPLDRKLFISFAHDVTITPLMVALKLEVNPPQPQYAASFIMEMHRIRKTQEIGFKFVYRNGTRHDPIVYTVPGCEEICPLRFVKQVVQDVIPTKPFYELCNDSGD